MSQAKPDANVKVVLEPSGGPVNALSFHPDGNHIFSGTEEIRRWRVADSQEVRNQPGPTVLVWAVSVSKDWKWVACGTQEGASVWDAELGKQVLQVEDTNVVAAVDIAPDCNRFATGTWISWEASIWSITTGEKLVGPLEHVYAVKGIKFSPDGGRIATASEKNPCIHIFDTRNGDQLITIDNPILLDGPTTPIAWSMDAQQLFAVSSDSKIKSFDPSTGSHLGEWPIHKNDGKTDQSIVLSTNNKFIACSADRFVSIWDTRTHAQIGIVEDTEDIKSIALSLDGRHLATGSGGRGKITIWDLSAILPEPYLSVESRKESNQQGDKSRSNLPKHEASLGDDVLLEAELPPSTSAQMFEYDEDLSASSDECHLEPRATILPHSSKADAPLPVTSAVDVPDPRLSLENATSSKGKRGLILAGWLRTIAPKRHGRAPHLSLSPSMSTPPTVVAPPSEQPSMMYPAEKLKRTVYRPPRKPRERKKKMPKAAAKPRPGASSEPTKTTPRSQGGPNNAPETTKLESSGDQHIVEEGPEVSASSWRKVVIWVPSWCCCGTTSHS